MVDGAREEGTSRKEDRRLIGRWKVIGKREQKYSNKVSLHWVHVFASICDILPQQERWEWVEVRSLSRREHEAFR